MDGRQVRSFNYRPNSTTEYTRFRDEYFAGSDIRIYFGDIWVDEITSLQFTLQEQVAPIFGYASYTWDKVARGNRFIQGSFAINFKESYYLHAVMNSLSSKMKAETKSNPMFSTPKWKEGVTVEHLVNSGGDSKFDWLADEFEKSLWGEGQMIAQTTNRKKTTYFYPNLDSETEINQLNQAELADSGFNIIISYGPMNEAGGMKASETTHSLIGVQLTGVSQVIGGDGQPIQEQYSFIAKDLDGDVRVRA